MITAIYIGNDRLSLFEDEEIKVKSTVVKIEDITKVFTDTSNDFTIPADDINNAIYRHWYNADVLDSFDARRKVPAVIEISGINFKVGKIQLKKVEFKSGIPSHYSVVFYGNLVELKETLDDDKLTSLDLSALDFVYNSTNIRTKLQNSGDIAFSLLSKRRLLYDSSTVGLVDDKQTNIYFNNNNILSGLRPSDLTGSIKQLKIIEAIEDKYNLEFSRDFLGKYDFSNQYITLNGTDDKTLVQLPLTNADEGTDPTINGNVMLATGYGTEAQRKTLGVQLGIEVDNAYKDVIYSFYIKSGDTIVAKKDNVKGNFLTSNVLNVFDVSVNGGLTDVTFWLESSETITFQAEMYRNRYFPDSRYKYNSGSLTPTIQFRVAQRLPDIKIIDYLKGLFQMSKLVAIPQKDDSIYIDSLVNYYKRGKVYNLTDYIDYKSHTVSAGTLLNEINYKFEEPQTILNQQYLKTNGTAYGDLEHTVLDENGKQIDGKELDFKLPFEQIVYEKIRDLGNENYNSNIQYGLLQDENLNFATIKAHVHYIHNSTCYIKFINDDNISIVLTNVNIPSHILNYNLQSYSTTFNSEFSTFTSELINNTLYTNYHKSYIDLVFNKQKREYKFTAKNVPTNIVLSLNLNDVIEIKERFYRINSFETSTHNNDIEFHLINDRVVDLAEVHNIRMDSTIVKMDSTEITMDNI